MKYSIQPPKLTKGLFLEIIIFRSNKNYTIKNKKWINKNNTKFTYHVHAGGA